MKNIRHLLLFFIALFLFGCNSADNLQKDYTTSIRKINSKSAIKLAEKIRSESAVQLEEGLELNLWAVDSLVHDPIAISIDSKGKIYYTSATRQANSEFDIRGHRNWMTASISFETPEDRRVFLRTTFAEGSEESGKFLKDLNNDGILDWRDLTVEKEEVWWVADEDNDGVAEKAQLFISDFNEEITDVANGILAYDDDIYLSVAPDLWKITDTNKDGVADIKKSLSHGYAVHIGFSGHGMSGVTYGPDGRIWWGIGDIGMNVIDKEGNKWEYPNQGVIVRSEPDGSNFEVYAAGVRNTHEFVFDKYGNLITEDNDGDHAGERERLLYVINGSDSGWRSNWQYGKYTDPDNNRYKVWMDEKMSVPKWDGQAAYIIPPIQNYVNGPTGMVYNPGTALGEKWYEHFFIAEFRGNPANSPIHAFTLDSEGAGFKMSKTQEVVSGLLPTGMDFGPDGALYFSDWIDGWNTKDKGRIWKLDVDSGSSPIREETKALLGADFTTSEETQLAELLSHQDMRIRLKAQFELVKRGENGLKVFTAHLESQNDQMSRIHSIWGIAQLARGGQADGALLTPLISDSDTEIKAQAIKMLGDIKYVEVGRKLIPFLSDDSPRIQMLTAEAIGRIQESGAKKELLALLERNDNKDVYIRHAASLALARIGDAEILAQQISNENVSVRLAAVVALRRMGHTAVAKFLTDKNELVVTEAARAINDDRSISEALPALADILNTTNFSNEALIRRSINANFRIGEEVQIDNLVQYISNPQNPDVMKSEALACLSTWEQPSVLDRVDGRNRNLKARDASYVKTIVPGLIDNLVQKGSDEMLSAAVQTVAKLGLKEKTSIVEDIYSSTKNTQTKKDALTAIAQLGSENIDAFLEEALASSESELRASALSLIPLSNLPEEKAISLFNNIIEDGTILEKQTALSSLSGFKGKETIDLLSLLMNKLEANELENSIKLDVIGAIETTENETLISALNNFYEKNMVSNPLIAFEACLEGGNARSGRGVFFRNEAAQCVRCHAVYEWGGNAGPGLQGVSDRLSDRELLASLIIPSEVLSPGFGVMTVTLNDDSTVSGVMEEENDDEYILKISKDEFKKVLKSEVKSQSFLPSSMPAMDKILTKKQIRDLVAFLKTLKNEEEG
jgi:putative membrane-bound dehydrogenase-like protein